MLGMVGAHVGLRQRRQSTGIVRYYQPTSSPQSLALALSTIAQGATSYPSHSPHATGACHLITSRDLRFIYHSAAAYPFQHCPVPLPIPKH